MPTGPCLRPATVRARLSANAMAGVMSLLYAAVLVAVVLSRDLALTALSGPPPRIGHYLAVGLPQ